MIISFKFKDYDEIREEYAELFGGVEPQETEERDGLALVADGVRVVIPEIKASFREAGLFEKNKEAESAGDEWISQGPVYVCYEQDETDADRYLGFVTNAMYYAVQDACLEAGVSPDLNELDCYIDTDEFAAESEQL